LRGYVDKVDSILTGFRQSFVQPKVYFKSPAIICSRAARPGKLVRPKNGGPIMNVDYLPSLERGRNAGGERKATAHTMKSPTKRITRLSIFAMTFGLVLFAFAVFEFVPIIIGCGIKGNVNSTGERIYHMPGQKYYFQTGINWLGGERWFCSELDARAAGWRKARS
jgi:hypothetical protein